MYSRQGEMVAIVGGPGASRERSPTESKTPGVRWPSQHSQAPLPPTPHIIIQYITEPDFISADLL